MATRRSPGLVKRRGIWRIDKIMFGRRICESTGSRELEEAEKYLARRREELRQAEIYGIRLDRDFNLAAAKFLMENQHLASIDRYADALAAVQPYIGKLAVHRVHMGSLQKFIKRERTNSQTRTINYSLQAIRRVLNLAASEWLDESGLTWLAAAPKIKLLPEHDRRQPYPLSWEEQEKLFAELPEHLEKMALFAVNTGCREAEICALQWDWEVSTPGVASGSVFIVPKHAVKNREERLIVLNNAAREVIDSCREQHSQYVFTYRGKRLAKINQDGWRQARIRAKLEQVRVHDLRHTFGRRLRAAGVSFEDRQDLLGHKSARITTHYSAAELSSLYEAASKVCKEDNGSYPTLTILKREKDVQPLSPIIEQCKSRKSHARLCVVNLLPIKKVL